MFSTDEKQPFAPNAEKPAPAAATRRARTLSRRRTWICTRPAAAVRAGASWWRHATDLRRYGSEAMRGQIATTRAETSAPQPVNRWATDATSAAKGSGTGAACTARCTRVR